jgi:hypothetical protein
MSASSFRLPLSASGRDDGRSCQSGFPPGPAESNPHAELEDFPRPRSVHTGPVRKRSAHDRFDEPTSRSSRLGERAPFHGAESVDPSEVPYRCAEHADLEGGRTFLHQRGGVSRFR